ncbi:replication restart helicase PriA [Flavobacterium sp.]|uniref:replication restart helicase PriA n=1 Tax=Flavobacterium sp. TaxID=239 RepID=UPI003B9D9143
MPYINVVLPLAVNTAFTYFVTNEQLSQLQIGIRVVVPFGQRKLYTALVSEYDVPAPQVYEAKPVHDILDESPIVTKPQLQLWLWIADYYMCSVGEVFRAAMPSALLLASETIVSAFDTNPDTNALDDDEYLVYEAMQVKSSLTIAEVEKIIGKKVSFKKLQRLISSKVVKLEEEVKEVYKPKLVSYIRLAEAFQDKEALPLLLQELSRAEKQKMAVLAFFDTQKKTDKYISYKEFVSQERVSQSAVDSLITKGVFEKYYIETSRLSGNFSEGSSAISLSAAQAKAKQEITDAWTKSETVLLKGVTASGKTEVYMSIINDLLNTENQVLYLLPEIALTTQLVGRLRKQFGNKVAVYHSRLSINERVEVWKQILERKPEAQIVIGARSALLLPFSNLDCIVIDEEHEPTFKQQDPAPRYHARDAALVLARFAEAKVLLGSATPSLESTYNVKTTKYGYVELNERFALQPLPQVEIVDLKDKQKRKLMTGHFSDTLLEAIRETLEQKQQIILFQNRRGYSPITECITCGHVPHCNQCDVALTYHQSKNQLRCHYCGFSVPQPVSCYACKSQTLIHKGFGTEQIQNELQELFPNIRVLRMDQDSTSGKFAFEKIIDSFKNREAEILVGTQMVAKGLDFSAVTLVGIMDADSILYQSDFRANERTFQLFTQVAGRAGRSTNPGKVILQTYNPFHFVLKDFINNDYAAMVDRELQERQQFYYPPVFKLAKLTFKSKNFELTQVAGTWFANALKEHTRAQVLGPIEPAVGRIRNEYLQHLMVKYAKGAAEKDLKEKLRKIRSSFEAIAQFKSVRLIVNIDYY